MTRAAIDPSITLARAAIQEAERRGFSIDADTFRVWFAYVSDEDELVTAYIDRLDARGDEVSRDDIERLVQLLPTDPPKAALPLASVEPVMPEPEPEAPRPTAAVVTDIAEARQARPAATPKPMPAEPAEDPVFADEPRQRTTTPFDKLADLPNRHAFSKDVRRRWLHPESKRGPQTIFLSSCRRAGDTMPAEGRDHLVTPLQAVMLVALTRVFEKLGTVYRYDPQTIALILSGVNLRQTVSIAEAVRRSLEAKRELAESCGGGTVLFSSAAVSLMANEDPAKALALAGRCLSTAMSFDDSRVVCETDPVMQPPAAATGAERPIVDQYARIRQLLQS
ncbi:hypothetical protein [Amorphus orientalis]|uniref:GGDEF domain-containing protein n=1 Tax=Amorphus orientalis TaxID=649198 RepID=A0AAE3VTT3_9HYPH|nr:hypothetical protein [Amorphus orientalis]MDQ0317688.1 GGDEF domain-containing protein [Amorphus orientalis]